MNVTLLNIKRCKKKKSILFFFYYIKVSKNILKSMPLKAFIKIFLYLFMDLVNECIYGIPRVNNNFLRNTLVYKFIMECGCACA